MSHLVVDDYGTQVSVQDPAEVLAAAVEIDPTESILHRNYLRGQAKAILERRFAEPDNARWRDELESLVH